MDYNSNLHERFYQWLKVQEQILRKKGVITEKLEFEKETFDGSSTIVHHLNEKNEKLGSLHLWGANMLDQTLFDIETGAPLIQNMEQIHTDDFENLTSRYFDLLIN